MMRILFATSNAFIPDHISGQNRTLLELASRLKEMGHEPVILSATGSPNGRSAVFSDKNHGFRILRATDPVRSLPALGVTLRPDVAVVADGNYDGLIEGLKSLGVPLAVWFFHAEPSFFIHDQPDTDLLYLASSRFLADRVSSLFGIQAEVVPPFIASAKYRQPRSGKRVLFVNPVFQKGLEIAFSLARQRPHIPFTFVESWGLSEKWRKSCFDRAVRCGNIEWLPKTVDMTAAFEQTRLLLVPRYTEEGFCRLVTEAQMGGIPVLASNRGHLAENVGAGGSVLDFDGGIDAWLEHLDRYFTDDVYCRRVGEEARNHAARDEIRGQAVAERLLGLLEEEISRYGVRRFGRGGR